MNQTPQQNSRQIRVFISSTFRDMQAERDHLVKFIFPQLRKLCEERAVTWTEVDLRWGITDEQKSEGKVLPLCLEEIHRCRPYFIGLLGERYGWIPELNSISPELLETQPWLRQHLRQSVTELEILHGVFNEEPMHGHAFFYFREPKYSESVPNEKRQDFCAESPEAVEKLEKLKQRIRGARDEQVCRLRENYSTPEQLGEWVLEDFTELIKQLYPSDHTPDRFQQETARHESYAQNRRLAFVGRDDLLRNLSEVSATSGKPLVLIGESGCGKSALLAEWAARWRKDHPEDLIIQHYIGSTPDSADWRELVRRILGEIKRAFVITDEIPLKPNALFGALGDWTAKAEEKRRVVLVVDALNQLTDDGIGPQLGWLPVHFPANFRVLVSSLPGESLDCLRERGWEQFNVPLFGKPDIAPATLAYFKLFGKTPSRDLVSRLESAPAACNALFLRAILDELRQYGSHLELMAKAEDYLCAPDPAALYNRILTRWAEDFGERLVFRGLSLINSARRGLSESELLDLLGSNGHSLPRAHWTPFFLAAENSLIKRSGMLGLGHDYLRKALRDFIAATGIADVSNSYLHATLANYFMSRVMDRGRLDVEELTKGGERAARAIDEFPWHLQQSEEWDQLVRILTHVVFFPCIMHIAEDQLTLYWAAIGDRFDMGKEYIKAVEDVPAEMRMHFGQLAARFLTDMGHFREAQQLLREIEHTRPSNSDPTSQLDLARVLIQDGKLSEAASLLDALSALPKALRPEGAWEVNYWAETAKLAVRQGQLDRAEEAYRKVLELVGARVDDQTHLATVTGQLAEVIESSGRLEQAEEMFQRALSLSDTADGRRSDGYAMALARLGRHRRRQGRIDEAVRDLSESLGMLITLKGKDHPHCMMIQGELAHSFYYAGRKKEAQYSLVELIASSKRIFGPESATTLTHIHNLGAMLMECGDLANAANYLDQAYMGRSKLLGEGNADTLIALIHLAIVKTRLGDHSGAEGTCNRLLSNGMKVIASALESDRDVGHGLSQLGRAMLEARWSDLATMVYREHLAVLKSLSKPNPQHLLECLGNLAAMHYAQRDHAVAKDMYEQAIAVSAQFCESNDPNTIMLAKGMGLALEGLGRKEEALKCLKDAHTRSKRVLGVTHPLTVSIAKRMTSLGGQSGVPTKDSTPSPQQMLTVLRQLAGKLVQEGEYGKAKEILNKLVEFGFELASTYSHLARVALLTDDLESAWHCAEQGWKYRAEARLYVTCRVLWFRIAGEIVSKPQPEQRDLGGSLGMIKAALENENAHMDWAMQPVLDHLKPKLSAPDHALLTALVAAMSDRAKLPEMDHFPEWRDAIPQPFG